MNDQVEQKANELLLNLIDKTQQGMEFAEAQIPDLIEQLLVWKFAVSMMGFVLWAAIFAGAVFMFRHSLVIRRRAIDAYEKGEAWTRFTPESRQTSSEYDFMTGGVIPIVSGVACIISLLITACQIDWIQIWLAPKVYLLEYAASLAK